MIALCVSNLLSWITIAVMHAQYNQQFEFVTTQRMNDYKEFLEFNERVEPTREPSTN